MLRDDDDSQMDGIAEFFKSWPARDVKGWETETPELERDVDEGGCWTGGEFWISTWSIKVLEALTRDAVETSNTTGSGSLLALLGMVSRIQPSNYHAKSYLLTIFSNRHAPNPPLNSQHHSLHPRVHRFQPQCSSSCRSLPSSAEAFPGHKGKGGEAARDGYCQEGEAYQRAVWRE
jgi:hypothetical protein